MSGRLRRFHPLLLLAAFGALPSFAQELATPLEPTDSLFGVGEQQSSILIPHPEAATAVRPEFSTTAGEYIPRTLRVNPNFFDPTLINPSIPNLSGYVSHADLPGLMGIESAALGYTFANENLSFTPSVFVDKYGYFGGYTRSLGLGGNLTWRISDRVSLTAFGAYHSNSWALNPAVMANMGSTRFGGYATYHFNERWALSVGAQRVYNSATGRWETIPIVQPEFKIGSSSLGLDVGGILYELLHNAAASQSSQRSNPTIAPYRPPIPVR